MVSIICILIGLYAVLTATAGISQWREEGFRIPSFLFVFVSVGILIVLFRPNKDWMVLWLILAFVLLHLLAIAEGMLRKGQLAYSHHIIRFIFHCIMIILVYKFII